MKERKNVRMKNKNRSQDLIKDKNSRFFFFTYIQMEEGYLELFSFSHW